jgi:glycosyltransferase involved in cell wall biosynthesis
MNSFPERLRILQILPCFGTGGAEQMASHLMIRLAEQHEVAAVATHPPLQSPIEARLRQAHIPVWFLGKHRGFDLRMYGAIDRVVCEFRPHVAHTHLSVLRYALPALIRRRVPVVIHTLHNSAEHETDLPGRIIHRFAFRRRVVPVTISSQGADSFRRVYGFPCEAVVPNGIPVEMYRHVPGKRIRWRQAEGFSSEDVVFMSVGRLEPQKNPMLLVRAFAAMQAERAHLVMLGQGTLFDEVASYVAARGLQSRIHLLGRRQGIPECLSAADVFVMSSDWEGNPLAVMEAMSAGLPVISTSVGGVPDLVESGRHGMLVPRGDQDALTAAMLRLLNDGNLRSALGAAAYQRASEAFPVERMTDEYLRLYTNKLAAALPSFRSVPQMGSWQSAAGLK